MRKILPMVRIHASDLGKVSPMPHGYLDTPQAKEAADALALGFIHKMATQGGGATQLGCDVFFTTGPGRIGGFWMGQHNGELGRVRINPDMGRRITRLLQERLHLRSADGTFGDIGDRFPGEFKCHRPDNCDMIVFTALLSELAVLGPWLAGWIWAVEHQQPIPEGPFPIATCSSELSSPVGHVSASKAGLAPIQPPLELDLGPIRQDELAAHFGSRRQVPVEPFELGQVHLPLNLLLDR